jgi:hypothetical protein
VAHSFVLQDWLLLQGNTNSTITQSEDEWLDLFDYQDVTFYLLVNQASATTTIAYQTSPDKTDAVFANMVSPITLAASATPVVTQVLMLSATVPLARYVRWQVIGGVNAWSASFRVVLSANAPGL